MKRLLFLIFLLLSGMMVFSQDNPYAVFGYETHMRYEPAEADFFAIENKDTTGEVRKLVFCFDRQQINLIGSDGTVLDVVRIQPHLTLRFLSPDPKEKDYPALSPYNFVANMPLRAVDPDGREIYILFYTEGSGSSMFKSAAETRQRNIEKGQFFDPAKDKVVVLRVADMADIRNQIQNVVTTYSEQYGETREFGIWSHAGWDGPRGSVPTSENQHPNGLFQMSLEGWRQIDFNWTEVGANATFYGCNTGNDIEVSGPRWRDAFARNVSKESNFEGVQVAGQSSWAYPSANPFTRLTSLSRSGGIYTGDTYMIGGDRKEGKESMWFTSDEAPISKPLNIYRSGQKTGSGFQSFASENPVIGQ